MLLPHGVQGYSYDKYYNIIEAQKQGNWFLK
jgi:hypothetical protein